MEYRELKRAVQNESAKVIENFRKQYKLNMETYNYTTKGKQNMISELIKEADKQLSNYKRTFVESGYEVATQKKAQIQGQRAQRKNISDASFMRNAMVVDAKIATGDFTEQDLKKLASDINVPQDLFDYAKCKLILATNEEDRVNIRAIQQIDEELEAAKQDVDDITWIRHTNEPVLPTELSGKTLYELISGESQSNMFFDKVEPIEK